MPIGSMILQWDSSLGEDKIIIDHTYVSEVLKGQGVGQQLVKKVMEYARQENKKIIALCPFAKNNDKEQ